MLHLCSGHDVKGRCLPYCETKYGVCTNSIELTNCDDCIKKYNEIVNKGKVIED